MSGRWRFRGQLPWGRAAYIDTDVFAPQAKENVSYGERLYGPVTCDVTAVDNNRTAVSSDSNP